MTQAWEVCIVTMTDVMNEEIVVMRLLPTELLVVGILIVKQTRHVRMSTFPRMSIPWALGVTHIDVATMIPTLTIITMTVRPHHTHLRTIITLPLTIQIMTAGTTLAYPIITTVATTSTTDVMTPIVVVRTIALAYRRAWGLRSLSLMVPANPKTSLIGSPAWTPTSLGIAWILTSMLGTRRCDLVDMPRSFGRMST